MLIYCGKFSRSCTRRYRAYQRWRCRELCSELFQIIAAYSPAVIHYHIYFLLTIITHVKGGGGGAGGGQMGWKRDLCNIGYPSNTTPTLFKSQKILFSDSTGFKSTPTKRRLTTSHLPIILEPVLKRALPSYTIYSNFPSLPSLTFYGLFPLSFSRFCDTRIFS